MEENISVNTEEVRSFLNSINIKTSTNASTYSGETETKDYIVSLFTNGIEKAEEAWNSVKGITEPYLKKVLIYPDPEPPMGTIKEGTFNFREGPGKNSKWLGTVETGEKVEILEDDGSSKWVLVRKEDGTEGYISRSCMVDNEVEQL